MNTRRKPTQAESLGAGIVAGAVEGFITYPAEFVKTKAQFSRSGAGEVGTQNRLELRMLTIQRQGVVSIVKNTLRTGGITALYSGCGALVVGNGLKAGVRFMTYDSIKELLRDPEVSSIK
jgi:solute carrier family 25 citrate transporter 1